jgi:hypothetical protein
MGSVIKQQQDAARLAEAQRAQVEAEAKRQEQVNAMFENLKRPGATARDYANLAMVMPKDASESILNSLEALNEAERAAALKDTGEVFSLFVSGNTDLAIKRLRMHAEAERASGNEEEAKKLEYYANQAEMGEDQAESIQHAIGYSMTAMPGGKDVVDTILKYNEDRRKAIEHPDLVAKQKADRDKAESDAEKARVDADYAERLKIIELKDKAESLGLTTAQTNETISRTKKLDAETAKLLLELDAAKNNKGYLTPEEMAKGEDALRTEYVKRTGEHAKIEQNWSIVQSAEGTGIGDVARIFAIMKMFDPTSVVREGEQATAQNAAGVPEHIRSIYNNARGEGKLSDKARAEIYSQAKKVYEASKKTASGVESDILAIADRRGLNKDNIVPKATEKAQAEERDLPNVKEYLKSKWPNESAKIDAMRSISDVKSLYPKTYSTYKKEGSSRVGSVVEVDF